MCVWPIFINFYKDRTLFRAISILLMLLLECRKGTSDTAIISRVIYLDMADIDIVFIVI